jgi:hypothetical protein
MTPPNANITPNTDEASRPAFVERLEPATSVVSAAHDVHLNSAIDSVHWERRGLLGRLTRTG